MSRIIIIFAIAASYFVFAMLLNSVGIVILQAINSLGVTKLEASTLEGFKDLPIAFASFFIASFIPRIGYKLALMIALIIVTIACIITPIIASFWVFKLLFACIGVSFALVKVSVYSIIGQLSNSTNSHSALLNSIEGIFMLGSLSGYWLFSWYIDPTLKSSTQWLNVYYPLAGIIIVAFLLVLSSSIQKPEPEKAQASLFYDFFNMLKMAYQPLVMIFIISIFLYVLIEQSIGTWLPTFNREVIGLPTNISVQMTSIFAASLALGRLLAGQLLKHIHWYVFLNFCLGTMILIILVILPFTSQPLSQNITSLLEVPLAAYLLPLVGLMMAPIYPALNSVMLSCLKRSQHAAMTGLIVVFSALGGTTGSVITGFVFEILGGQQAFYMSIIPMLFILISLYFFRKLTQKTAEGNR